LPAQAARSSGAALFNPVQEITMFTEQRSPLESLAAYAIAFAAGALVLAGSHAYAEWRVRREKGGGY
jgi:hypothetical protein